MLPWLIGAAVLGVGAAIVSAVKDSSDDSSSSSSSDYEDKRREQEERERNAKIESSERQIAYKLANIEEKWHLRSLPKQTLLISGHKRSTRKPSESFTVIHDKKLQKQEKLIKSLENELKMLNAMAEDISKALNNASNALSVLEPTPEVEALEPKTHTPAKAKAKAKAPATAKAPAKTKATATKATKSTTTKGTKAVAKKAPARAKSKLI